MMQAPPQVLNTMPQQPKVMVMTKQQFEQKFGQNANLIDTEAY